MRKSLETFAKNMFWANPKNVEAFEELMREDTEKRCPWCGKRVTTPEESAARGVQTALYKKSG